MTIGETDDFITAKLRYIIIDVAVVAAAKIMNRIVAFWSLSPSTRRDTAADMAYGHQAIKVSRIGEGSIIFGEYRRGRMYVPGRTQ